MKKRVIILVASLIVCALAAAACGTGQKGSGSSSGSAFGSAFSSGSGSANAAYSPKYKTIGKEGEKATTKKVLLQNLTGQDIKGLVIKHSGEEAFGANLLGAGDVFASDEVRKVVYDTRQALDVKAAKEKEADGSAFKLQYDVEITTADDKKYVIHNFPLDSVEQGNLLLEEEVMFLEYTDPVTGKDIDTKKEELAIKESEKKAQEEKAAAEKAAAEQAAAEQAAAEAAAWQAQQEAAAWQAQQEAAAWQAQQEAAAWAAQQQAAQTPPSAGSDTGCIGAGGLVY